MDTDDTIQVRSFSFDLSEALKTFLKLCPSESPAAQVCDRYLRLAAFTTQDRKDVMHHFAQWILEPTLTLKVASIMRPLIEELVYLARTSAPFGSAIHASTGVPIALEYNIRFASALSKLCRTSPACFTAAKVYFGASDVLRPLETLWPLLQKEQTAAASDRDLAIFEHASALIVEVLRTTWRLVKLSSFAINQASLLNLLHKFNPEDPSSISLSSLILPISTPQVSDMIQRVHALASQSLEYALGLSDAEKQTSITSKNTQNSVYLNMVDEEDSSEYQLMLASASWATHPEADSSVNTVYTTANHSTTILTASDLQSGLVDVSGFLLQSNNSPDASHHSSARQLIITPTTSHNLEALALAIGNEKPVLLQGPTGSGKSALISHVANLVKRELTTIHIGDALDGKSLLGGYVATEVPGQFKWVEGPLTRAVVNGHWLIIEDLDLASSEVYGILQPLVQSRQLFIPSRAETIYADHGFSLFATATTATALPTFASTSSTESGEHASATTRSSHASASLAASALSKLQQSSSWTHVVIDPLNSTELAQVIELGYGLGQLAHRMVATHEALVIACAREGISLRATERPLTTRDCLRWATRVRAAFLSKMRSSIAGITDADAFARLGSGNSISSGLCELVVREGFDIYISPSQHATLSETRMEKLASGWTKLDRATFLFDERPTIEPPTESMCLVGRSTLPINSNPKTITPPLSTLREVFVPTTRSVKLLEWLSMAVEHSEPVLLVGETGGGKTSTIQNLAARTRRKLVVLNMSQSSDTVDLLGGFKPIELSMLATPLKRVFERLFIKTFSKTKNQDFIDRVLAAHAAKDWRALASYFVKSCKLAQSKFEQRRIQEQQSAAATLPAIGSSPPPRDPKRRKDAEELDEETLRQAFAVFDDLDASTFPFHLSNELQWRLFDARVQRFGSQVEGTKAFQFVEGALVKAVQRGEWVLLDEINLASAETLECLSGLLEGESLVLTERGDAEAIHRHADFRLFAAMNPANDVGKSNLPAALRARFSEFYLSELEDRADLAMIVNGYLQRVNPKPPALSIVDFYLNARKESEARLVDGSNQKPRFNLRSLSRALEFCADTTNLFGFDRALFEGIQLAFLTQLNTASYDIMNRLIHQSLRPKSLNDKMLKSPPSLANFQRAQSSSSAAASTHGPVTFEQFMMESGPQEPFKDPRFIVTETTQKHLTHLARALTTRKYPLLLQGPTSAGKTSMIEYLAKLTGHRFVRVNNSEQTDLQEYLGQYIHDAQGRLVYHDGVLVEALRHGHWIVLDELNLAPSEVLEALNRLLDDNRQLYVPELQEYITPHPHFCLFATQNPPGLYGGRKVLSRAFRSRFLELHIDEIPDAELQLILEQRSHLPASYCQRLVAIMKDLQRQRQGTKVFAGRHGFVTLRDLFRWAERRPTSYDELAIHGYFLLADRLREVEEREIVRQVLEKHLKVSLNLEAIYEETWRKAVLVGETDTPVGQQSIVWTAATKRLFGLMGICLRHKEPILLVGPPGTGKTAISQLHAELLNQHLEILNCHQNSEAADFIGGLRPVRGKDSLEAQLASSLKEVFSTLHSLFSASSDAILASSLTLMGMDQDQAAKTKSEIESQLLASGAVPPTALLERLMNVLPRLRISLAEQKKAFVDGPDYQQLHNNGRVVQAIDNAEHHYAEFSAMFLWYDGPLVRTMKRGQAFLVDEISLADDAVLERLNSVLEPSRLLVLAEKGGREIEELIAHPDFRIIATMNPGGDFGKKELSPALRNRFTEIFVPAVDQREDLIHIILKRLHSRRPSSQQENMDGYADRIVDFVEFFSNKTNGAWSYSLRDILAWVDFIATTTEQLGARGAYLHGVSMLVLDGLGITNPINADSLKRSALEFLDSQQLPEDPRADAPTHTHPNAALSADDLVNLEDKFGLGTFTIPKTPGMDIAQSEVQLESYSMKAPTTLSNLLRLLRALQLPKPLLLEGSPGVGKTTIVEALGAASGRKVVRINLSEQTDMLDLLGADLPVEDDANSLRNLSDSEAVTSTAKFEWRDGVFLNALKNGDWVLLDELNLANQSVLEGLNAVLDHRGTVFIPELNTSFVCPPSFRIFAAQNPTAQGGGRKGLPKSFLNRFTKVYLDAFSTSDLNFIANTLFPELGSGMIKNMVDFNTEVYRATMETFAFGRDGAPWEFNLRDILRWCKLVQSSTERTPDAFVQLLYLQRFRTETDRAQVVKLFEKCFGRPLVYATRFPHYQLTPTHLQVGQAILPRVLHPYKETAHGSHHGAAAIEDQPPLLLQHLMPALESLMKCVEFNWLAILVGPTASGKTSLLKSLAWLTGSHLSTFSVNPSVDTLEILGGFEQIDLNRHAKKLIERISQLVSHVSRLLLQPESSPSAMPDAFHLATMWNLFQSQAKAAGDESSFSGKSIFASESQLRLTNQLLELLDTVVSRMPASTASDITAMGVDSTDALRAAVAKIGALEAKSVAGSFEWVDGLLIDAMIRGHWIVMDNVNTCPGPVLDRLLPLLEPNGLLRLNERGLVDGQVSEIVPHPNFRIFFTMDPKYGDISRAMRNRGIEIGMTALPTDAGCVDMVNLLARSMQFYAPVLFDRMTHFHNSISKHSYPHLKPVAALPVDTSLGLTQLLHWAELTLDQLQRGESIGEALKLSMEQVYARGQPIPATRTLLRNHFLDAFADLDLGAHQSQLKQQLISAPGYGEKLNMANPEAAAFALLAHSKVFLGAIAAPIVAGTPCFFALEQLLLSSSMTSLQTWATSLSAFIASNATALLGEGSDGNTLNILTEWMCEQFRTSDIVQHAQASVSACVELLLDHNKKDSQSWMKILSQGEGITSIRRNIPFWRMLTSLSQSSEVSRNVYAAACASLDRVRLWCLSLPQQFYQLQVLNKVTESNFSNAGLANHSVIEQSLALTLRKITKTSLTHPIAAMLSSFFAEFDAMFVAVLSDQTNAEPLDAALLQELQLAIKLRHHLWRWLVEMPARDFQVRDFVPSFNWLVKAIRQLQTSFAPRFVVSDAMDVIITHMNSIVSEELGTKYKPTLWKRAGHPSALKNSALFELQTQLNALPVSHKASLKDSHGTVLRALSTLMWINTFPESQSVQAKVKSLFNSISHVPESVQQTMSQATNPLADVAGSSQRTADHQSELKYPLIAPIFDLHLIHLEVFIVQQVQELLNTCQVERSVSNIGARLSSLVPVIQHLLQKAAEHTTTPPRMQAGYQLLLWIIDSNGATASAGESAGSATFILLQSLFSELHTNLGERRLYNSIGDAPLVVPLAKHQTNFLPPIVLEIQKKALEKDMTYRELLDAGMELPDLTVGPDANVSYQPNDANILRLQSAYRTAYTMARVTEWKQVPVVSKQVRMQQMETLLAFLCESGSEQNSALVTDGQRSVECDWSLLVDTLCITAQCFSPDASVSASIAALPDLFKKLLRESSTANLAQALPLVEILASMPSKSADARFADLGARHIAELTTVLSKMLNYAHQFWTLVRASLGVSDETEALPDYILAQNIPRLLGEPVVKLWRGNFQMELALLRATLVIPSQPIDVSTKYASRALIIEQMKAQVETRLNVLLDAERHFTGAPSNYEIEQERKLLVKIDELLALAKERQLSRPTSAPAFHTLWSQIHSLFQSHCDHGRYLEIVKNFNTILLLPRAMVASQWPALLLRETQVQNNLTQAISGLQTQFMPYYPDVVGPFINCVFELKSALRVIRFATEMMMPSALLLGTASVDAVSSMMTTLQLEEEAEIRRKVATGPNTTISLAGPALSASSDSMYALASHLQQVVSKLIEVPRTLSLVDVSLVLSKTTFEAVTALARLNQARAQAAVTETQLQEPLTKGNNIAARITQWMLSASRTSAILHLQSSLLRASLDSVFDQMRTQGYISQEAYDSLDRIFTVFVETYQAAKAEEERKRAAEAEFYKYKTRDNTVEHQHDVDEAAFKSMFPDYYAEFEDILGPQRGAALDPHSAPTAKPPRDDDDSDNDDEGEDAYKRKKAAQEAAENSPAVMFQGQIYQLNDGEVYQLCRIHFKVFSILRTYLQPGVQEVADATDFDELEELEAAISAKRKKGKQRADAAAEWLNSSKAKRQLSERSHTFMSAYETATKLVNLMGEVLPRGEQDSALEGAHILALQQCIEQLTANWRNPSREKSKKKVSKQKRLAARQRRLEASKSAVVTSFMSSHELVSNFYSTANAGEASLLQEPLSLFQQRLEDLLATTEIGVNEILITIWKLVTRLLEANVNMPLMHFVTGLELLIDRAHDWEDNQPSRYSIREHMSAAAKFITRWRAMELQFWPQILTAKEQQFQISGSKWWFFLYSLLHDAAVRARILDAHDSRTPASGDAMDTDAQELPQLDLNGLLAALQEYIETSSYGEFPTRLHLLVSFYYQFQAETALNTSSAVGSANLSKTNATALVTMLYNVYRYYAQFLPLLQVEMFKLKETVQAKLEDFIKISKWDDASFYRLRLTTQASHRNLMKLTKNYEVEVLTLPFRGFLEIVATNESLEQLKKEAPQAVIVTSVKLGQHPAATTVGPASKSSTALVSIQTLAEMKQRSQQLVVPANVGSQVFTAPKVAPHPALQLLFGASATDKTSLHLRLDSLFAKVSKHSGKLLPQQFEFAHRSHIQLENLTTELIEGILEMRAVAETPLKKRAFAGMLSELKTIGLDHHKTAVKAVLKQQLLVSAAPNTAVIDVNALHDLPYLFREPVCEEVVSKLLLVAADHASRTSATASAERSVNILTEALDTFWSKSDDYFYKLLAQVLLLRSKHNSYSNQLSRSEATQSLGFADHVFALVVHQRRTMCIALERHEAVEKLATAASRLASDLSSVNAPSATDIDNATSGVASTAAPEVPSHVLPAQAPLRRALMLQKGDLDSLMALTTSMSDLVRTLASTPSPSRNQLSELLEYLSTAISGLTESRTAVESELSAHTQTSSLSRAIADGSSTDSSPLVMGPQSYFALIASDVQITAVAEKIASHCAGVLPRFLPQIVRFRAHREQSLLQRDSSLALLLDASTDAPTAAFGHDESAKTFLTDFLKHFNSAVESLLLSVQRVYKLEKGRISSESKLIEERRKEAEEHRAALALQAAEEAEAASEMQVDDEAPADPSATADEGDLTRAEGRFNAELSSETDRFLPLDLVSSMKHLDSLTLALDAPRILAHFSAASSTLANFVDSLDASSVHSLASPNTSVVRLGASLLHQFYPLLKQWSSLHLAHVHNRAILCKSSSKFAHVLVSCMASIMKDGFCIKPKASDGEGEEGQDVQTDGMGLGEGEGETDVTDRYDNEEDLLGEKPLTEKEDAPEDPNKPPVDPDTGVEMENDFDGEMHDIEQKDQQKKNQQEDEEDEEGDLMDREMGDLDPDQEEILDEKLWDDEDDEDDKDGKDGKQSYEKNAPIDGNDDDEKEMEARLDDEPAADEDDQQQPQQKGKKQDPKKSADEDDEEGDEDGEDGPQKGDDAGDDAPEEDDPIHNQEDDRYEDSHNKKPHGEEEEFELPEDMNLDDEDQKGKDEEGKMDLDDNDDEGETEGDKEGDEPLPFPEKPDAINDEEGGKEGDEEDPTKDGDQDQPEGDDQEDDQKPPEDDPANPDTNDDEGIGSSARAMDEDEGDNGDDEGEKPDEEEREKVGQSKDDGKDYSEAFGIADDQSLPQQQNVKTSEENQQRGGGQDNNQQSSANEESNDDKATAASAGASGSTSVKPTPSKPSPKDDPNAPKNSDQQEQQRQAPNQQKDANPLRSLGDALKHWERQLNVIEDRPDDPSANPEEEASAPAPQDDGAMDADKNQTFEFARDNEKADQQTLGIASEDQAETLKPEDYQMAMEEEEKKDEENGDEKPDAEKMDVDDQADPEQNTTVESKSRAPSNRIQTAPEETPEESKTAGDEEGADKDAKKDDEAADASKEDPDAEDDEKNLESFASNPNAGKDGSSLMDLDLPLEPRVEVELTPDDIIAMRMDLEQTLAEWKSDPANLVLGGEIWRQLQALTNGAAQQLCEQLRLLLEPTLKSKMQGDYRTGKRLNMRRVVTYVASQFRKDKIWLRRTQPNKRTYQVLLCLDDSQSVLLGNAAPLMREATATLCLALQRLQIGQIGLLKFGQDVDLLHPFATPFTDEAASVIMPQLTFEQTTTNMENLMRTSIQLLEMSRHEAVMSMGSSSATTMQLMFIIGDGRFGDKRQELASWLHRAQQNNIFVVFLIMDTLDKDQSILDIQSVSYNAGKMTIQPYIDDFPYAYYIILKDLDNLPHILSDALRQWFEMVNQNDRR